MSVATHLQAPPSPEPGQPSPSVSVSVSPSPSPDSLPVTGPDAGLLMVGATILIVVGSAVYALFTRRRRTA